MDPRPAFLAGEHVQADSTGRQQDSGIVRIATSSLAKNEATVPVTAEQADAACSNTNSDVIRIITTGHVDHAPRAR
jgi:predicted secreted protein